MNMQGLIGLGLVGAALWYFSKKKEEQLEIAEDAADLSETGKEVFAQVASPVYAPPVYAPPVYQMRRTIPAPVSTYIAPPAPAPGVAWFARTERVRSVLLTDARVADRALGGNWWQQQVLSAKLHMGMPKKYGLDSGRQRLNWHVKLRTPGGKAIIGIIVLSPVVPFNVVRKDNFVALMQASSSPQVAAGPPPPPRYCTMLDLVRKKPCGPPPAVKEAIKAAVLKADPTLSPTTFDDSSLHKINGSGFVGYGLRDGRRTPVKNFTYRGYVGGAVPQKFSARFEFSVACAWGSCLPEPVVTLTPAPDAYDRGWLPRPASANPGYFNYLQ